MYAASIRPDDQISDALSFILERELGRPVEKEVPRKKYWKRGGLSKSVARTPAASAANDKRTAKNTGKYGGD